MCVCVCVCVCVCMCCTLVPTDVSCHHFAFFSSRMATAELAGLVQRLEVVTKRLESISVPSGM